MSCGVCTGGFGRIGLVVALSSMLLLPLGVLAASSPVAYPLEDSFESYADGAVLVGTNGEGFVDGWVGSGDPMNEFVVVAKTYTYSGTLPLTNAAHTKVAKLSEQMCTNLFVPQKGDVIYVETATGNTVTNEWGDYTNVWVDFIVEAARLAEAPGTDEVPADAQVAMYFNSNGHLVVWHSHYDDGFNVFERWTELQHTSVDSTEFVRVTIKMDYLTDAGWTAGGPQFGTPFEDKFFSVQINGGAVIESDWAYPRIPVEVNEIGVTTNGNAPVKFLMHGGGNGGGDSWMSSFACGGKGYLDDLQVTVVDPVGPITDPYLLWLAANGVADGGDEDGDGADNMNEWLAGTDPNDPNSVFKIIQITSGSPVVLTFLASEDHGPAAGVDIERATNLLDASPWQVVDTSVALDPSGTNTWTDATPPAGGQAFYRASITE
jgi:hypothetical protein